MKILEILDDAGNYAIKVHGKPVKHEIRTKLNFPNLITTININEVFELLQQLVICSGNDDFGDLVSKKLGNLDDLHFLSTDKTINSHLETIDGKTVSDFKIIRHENW